MACCVFIQISPDAVQSFRCHFTTFNGSIREQLQVYLTYSKCNSVPPPRDGVRGVTVTKTGSGVTVASAKSERKNGISVQNTNQLAGNRTFIMLLTLISFRGKCLHSPYLLSLGSCAPLSLSDDTIPVSDTDKLNSAPWHDGDMLKLPQQITAAMTGLAPRVERSRGQNVKHSLMTNAEVWLRCWKTVYRQGRQTAGGVRREADWNKDKNTENSWWRQRKM